MSKLLVFALLIKTHTHTRFCLGPIATHGFVCMKIEEQIFVGQRKRRGKDEDRRKGKGKDRKGSISGLRLLF